MLALIEGPSDVVFAIEHHTCRAAQVGQEVSVFWAEILQVSEMLLW